MTPTQCRMARAALNWTVRDLAERSGVHRNTVNRFETVGGGIYSKVMQMRAVMEAAGVTFTDDGKAVCVRIGE